LAKLGIDAASSHGHGDQRSHFKEMIDVGLLRGALPALASMPPSRDVGALDDEKRINLGRN
jgi:hypothetical protein